MEVEFPPFLLSSFCFYLSDLLLPFFSLFYISYHTFTTFLISIFFFNYFFFFNSFFRRWLSYFMLRIANSIGVAFSFLFFLGFISLLLAETNV